MNTKLNTHVKILSSMNSLSDLENDINNFIQDKTIISIKFVADMGRHTALIHYSETII